MKKHIFNCHKYFGCFTLPSTACLNKTLYKNFTYTTKIKY